MPASLALTPGAQVPVPFAADAVGGPGRLTLQIVAEGGSRLHWAAASGLEGAAGESLQASAAQGETTLTVSGTAQALSAWLSSAVPALRVSGSADGVLQVLLRAPGPEGVAGQPAAPGIA